MFYETQVVVTTNYLIKGENMIRKIINVVLAIMMLVSLTACSSNKEKGNENAEEKTDTIQTVDTSDDSENSEVNEVADPFGKYEPAIELTAVRYLQDGIEFVEGESINNNVWSKAYEESLGIKLDYLWTTAQAQYNQKFNVSIVTEVPDLMWVNAAQLKRMVEDDMLADLTEVYASYKAEFTDKVLHEDGGSAMESATFNEKLYGLPHIQSGYGSAQVLWIRTDWLKALGLSEPKTMHDVLNIARAFALNDPDKNGEKDTYGLAINKGLVASNNLPYAVLDGFFNAYHAYPTIWIEDENGELTYGGIQPEMKDALLELQSLYNEDVIDIEFGVKDASKVSEDVNSEKVGMLYGQFWNCGNGWLQDGVVNNNNVEWKAFPIMSIDEEEAKAMIPFATTLYTVVSKECENPEAIVKMYNLEFEKGFGKTAEPELYNVNKNNLAVFNYQYNYGEPPMKNLDAQTRVTKALENRDNTALNAEQMGYYTNCLAYLDGDVNFWGTYNMYGPEGSLQVINDYISKGNTLTDAYFGAPTDGMSEKNATLSKLQLESFTKIITGNADINEFDNYVQNWLDLGGEQITDEVNQWFKER